MKFGWNFLYLWHRSLLSYYFELILLLILCPLKHIRLLVQQVDSAIGHMPVNVRMLAFTCQQEVGALAIDAIFIWLDWISLPKQIRLLSKQRYLQIRWTSVALGWWLSCATTQEHWAYALIYFVIQNNSWLILLCAITAMLMLFLCVSVIQLPWCCSTAFSWTN